MTGTVGSWFAWNDLFAVGLAADVAGAVMLAWSFATKRPDALAEELLVVTRTYKRLGLGLAQFGASLARQKAEAHVGLVFLAGGFLLQLIGYLAAETSLIDTTSRRIAAAGLVLLVWAAAAISWKLYVPWRTAREVAVASEQTDRIIAADAAAAAEAARTEGDDSG